MMICELDTEHAQVTHRILLGQHYPAFPLIELTIDGAESEAFDDAMCEAGLLLSGENLSIPSAQDQIFHTFMVHLLPFIPPLFDGQEPTIRQVTTVVSASSRKKLTETPELIASFRLDGDPFDEDFGLILSFRFQTWVDLKRSELCVLTDIHPLTALVELGASLSG